MDKIEIHACSNQYRVLVEHVIGEVKCYKVIGTLWRHPRTKLKRIAEICAGLVCRRRQLNKTKLTVFFFCFFFIICQKSITAISPIIKHCVYRISNLKAWCFWIWAYFLPSLIIAILNNRTRTTDFFCCRRGQCFSIRWQETWSAATKMQKVQQNLKWI
jgi:hypothetical protein